MKRTLNQNYPKSVLINGRILIMNEKNQK